MSDLVLRSDQLAELAELVANRLAEQLLAGETGGSLVDAAEIARRYGVSRATVYDHASAWGAIRIGNGKRARLRFNPQRVELAIGGPPAAPSRPVPAAVRRRVRDVATHTPAGAPLLEVKPLPSRPRRRDARVDA